MSRFYRYHFTFLVALLLISNIAIASSTKNLWGIWQVYNPLSTKTISHQDWQDFLNKRVITNEEGINLVDYPRLTEDDLNLLKRYIGSMSHINISNYNRQEQLAYWINLYNALTIQTIVNYYPIGSIEEINISPGLFSVGPWGAKLITINNMALSLDDIQNRIIRPIWNDPRTLYALNNGSIGAANLSKQAYQGSTIDKQLNHAAFKYINSLRGVQVIEGALIVSKLYEWYAEDFGGTKQNIIKHLQQFAKEPLTSQLNHVNSVDSYIYNWHLNSTIVARSREKGISI
ncbi:putative Ser/Thr protein kinase [Legionella beliardensis]|uniref:Putative Ser/Thr protein kinase n=1 Tax=Legionella beliardensis TaxID=91822 RepID=A0A378HY70_9GAMM|nr:DUF547 domain-containing protein [Legionella beliardensis]STX27838.1 putative Ser/Thr protein kinase [Legionella beliardensis]